MEPTAWLHEKQPTAYVITARVKELWIASGNPEHVEHYTIPLYREDTKEWRSEPK